jgi:hypothetical protein
VSIKTGKGSDWPGLKRKEEQMSSLKPVFTRATITYQGLSPLLLLFWAVAIDTDRQRRQKEQDRRKWQVPMSRRARTRAARPF